MKPAGKKWLVISSGVLTCLVAPGFYADYALKRAEREFLESKWVCTTTATVTGKEFFRCEEDGCAYVNGYGDHSKLQPGDVQRRVCYQIDNFDQVSRPRRDRVIQAERQRVIKYGTRFTYDIDWYDSVKVGDKLGVRYRALGDGEIQVWGVDRR